MISQYSQSYQPSNNISVAFITNGLQGAQSYTVGAGNTVFMMDFDHKQFFVKETSPNGFPAPLRTFEFKETTPQRTDGQYVTKKEFDELRQLLMQAVQNNEVKEDDSNQ